MQDFNLQGFRFFDSSFKLGYGCFQFKYKDYEISCSNMGVDKGACPTKVAVFDCENRMISQHYTVQEAIDYLQDKS